MKKKTYIIYGILLFIIALIISIITILILNNDNKLTSEERTWINENINTIQNINVVKDANVFSKDGSGVIYTFLNNFSEEYDIDFNIITSETNSNVSAFSYTKELKDNSKIIYTDHYVLISNRYEIIKDSKDLEGKIIGVLNSDLEYVKSYLKNNSINFNGYETIDELFKNVGNSINYLILPRIEYIDEILSNNLEMIYHFSDIKTYYTFNSNGDILSSIIDKYLTKWEENIIPEIKNEEFKIFTKELGISDTEIDRLLSIDYKYGFINNPVFS